MIKISNHSKITQNNYYYNLLKDMYSGEFSETASLLQFLYFSYTLSDFENEFVPLLYSIAQDDLEHHTMLGECLIKLGGDAKYINSNSIAFGTTKLEYTKNIKNMLEYGIEFKERSLINYKTILNKVAEKEIKNILELIICDEQKHKDILMGLLQKYNSN